MPTTNPYSYDAPAADINKGSKPSTDNTYVTQSPTTTNGFTPPNASPPSFGGAGSSLAVTTEFGPPPPAPAPPPDRTPPPFGTVQPTSWTPPQVGTISPGGTPPGYNSPTPPPGITHPQGMVWVTDGQGHYGWGMANPSGPAAPMPTNGATTGPYPSGGAIPAGGTSTGPYPTNGAQPAPVIPMPPPYPGQPGYFDPSKPPPLATAPSGPLQGNPAIYGSPVMLPGGITPGSPINPAGPTAPPPDFWALADQPPPTGALYPSSPFAQAQTNGVQGPLTSVTSPVSGQTPVLSGTGALLFGPPVASPATGPLPVNLTPPITAGPTAITPPSTVPGTWQPSSPFQQGQVGPTGGGTVQPLGINGSVPHPPVTPPSTPPPPVTSAPPPAPPPTPAPTTGGPSTAALPLPTNWNPLPAKPPATSNPVPFPTRVPQPGDPIAPVRGTPDYRYPSDPAYYTSPTPPPGGPPGPGISWVTDGTGKYFWGTPSAPATYPPGDLHLKIGGGPGYPAAPPPWTDALNNGYPLPAFVNPGAGTIPTTQQWATYSPTEKAAVASLNWSTNGLSVDDLNNYMMQSAPQWGTPMPAVYKSY